MKPYDSPGMPSKNDRLFACASTDTSHWPVDYILQSIKEVLADGADVNYMPPGNWPVLSRAIKAGEPEVVQLLIDHGAKVDRGALMFACYFVDIRPDNEWNEPRLGPEYDAKREKIALAVIEKVSRGEIVLASRHFSSRNTSLLKLVESSAVATAALKQAFKKFGLQETGAPRTQLKSRPFLN